MFADLVGSTALSTRLDPEDLRDVITAHHRVVAEMVMRFDGCIARYLGDGVLAYFGYPQAHEDDAERAIRAGLCVVEATQRLNSVAGPPGTLRTRVGIASGVVVVGERIGAGPSLETNVVGGTPNLAARLQGLAKPGTVVVCETTRRLAGGLFAYQSLGAQQVRGFDSLSEPALVIGESGIDSRFEALRTGSVALVDREAEQDLLRRAWASATQGRGRVVVLRGDAGIGKSRLLAEFQRQIQLEQHLQLRFLCSPHYQNTALYPVSRSLALAADFGPDDTSEAKLSKLQRTLAESELSHVGVTMIADLLELPREAADPTGTLAPQRRKELTFAALLAHVQNLSRRRPVLVLLEDLQLADPSTLELFGRLVETVSAWAVLAVVTTRPCPLPAWCHHPDVVIHEVLPLKRHDAVALVRNALGERGLSEDIVQRIARRGDGVPLFIEELTKSAVESVAAASSATVPLSLQAALLERLDRRPAAKEVAQTASVIGRQFSVDLLWTVTDMSRARLNYAIRELEDADILVALDEAPHATFAFRHALVQDIAYASLLRDKRRAIHRRTAETLENASAGAPPEPELLAWHFGEAGLLEQSIAYHFKAAEKATGRSALAERVAQLRHALQRLQGMADNAATLSLELSIQVALGQALIDHLGSGNETVHAAFERAHGLCLALGDGEQLPRVHDGLINFHFTRSKAGDLLRIGDETAGFGRRNDSRQMMLLSRRASGLAHLLLGRFAQARDDFTYILSAYDVARDGPHSGVTTRDTRVAMTTTLGITLTALGEVSAGTAASMDGIAHAERLNHIPSLILGLRRACVQRMMWNDAAGAFSLAERLAEVSANYDTFLGPREGILFLNWAKAKLEPDPALLPAMRESTRDLAAAHHCVLLPFFLACAGAVHGELSDPHTTALLNQALDLSESTGERWCMAEILRLRACFDSKDEHEAATLLQRALDIARMQSAKLWELRCAVDLARLTSRAESGPTVASVLEPVLARYTDSHQTSDVEAACRLLAAQASSGARI